MQNDQESSSDRPESSSSGGGERSGGSSDSFEQPNNNNGDGPEQRVPQYVDMVIPDYESSGTSKAVSGQGGDNAGDHSESAARLPSRERAEEGLQVREDALDDEEDDEDGSLEEGSLDGDSNNEFLDDNEPPQEPCIPNENDVLLNSLEEDVEHPGNLRYRAVVRHLAKKYTKVKIGYRRAAVQILVNAVRAQGGRFLKQGRDGHWKEVSNKKAYHKSSHAIRCTCRRVEIVSSTRKRSKKRRRTNTRIAAAQQQEQERQTTSSETTSSTDYPAENERQNSKSNLEILALRLQTKDESLRHLSLDLHTVNHDFIFPFAKALDSSDLLRSLQLRLSHMNRTNANALAWGLRRCQGLRQVKLSYGKLSEKSSIILAGLLDNPSIESVNLDENEIGAEPLKAICRMISQSKGSKLQRLSLENNPFGDEGALVLAKLISSSRHLRFLSLGGNNLQAAGIAHIRAAIKKKTSCLFEVNGLESMEMSRKRTVGESTEDSNEDQANKKPRANPSTKPSGNTSGGGPSQISSSQPSSSFGSMRNQSSSNTSSSNETEMAPASSTGSDNGINNGTGSDDAPTSSMNDSDDNSPSSASN